MLKMTIMKTKIKHFLTTLLLSTLFLGLSSFAINEQTITETEEYAAIVSFKLVNDTNEDFKFFSDGAEHTIASKKVKACNWEEGHKLYFSENGKQGELWFEINAKMNGKRFNVSEL